MRYISHEMRTPLNVACLGIKILRDELERLGLRSLLETAIDTEKSCKTAVDILNDMLLFDKIVSGLMTLEKRRFDPLDLITKVMGPFYIQVSRSLCMHYHSRHVVVFLQAREAGAHLQLEQPTTTTAVRLHADPYKIAQVI